MKKEVVDFRFRMIIPNELQFKEGNIEYDKLIKREFSRHLAEFVESNFDELPIDKYSHNDVYLPNQNIQLEFGMISSRELKRLKDIEMQYNQLLSYRKRQMQF